MPDELETSISDAELFNGAQQDAAPEPKPEPIREPEPEAPKEVQAEVPRDDKGRFAPKAEKEEAPQPPAQPDTEHSIPTWRLREEAEAKREALKRAEAAEAERSQYQAELRAMQQRLATLEKPAVQEEVPDPLLDPAGYRAHFDRQLNERLMNQQREFDLRLAQRAHGKVFDQAYAEAQQAIASGDQQLAAMMQQSSSPGETLVQWFKQRQTVREVGDDPNAWLERKLEERLNDPAFLAKAMERARTKAGQTAAASPAVNLPPSLTSISSVGAHVDPDDGDNSDAAVFRQALRR